MKLIKKLLISLFFISVFLISIFPASSSNFGYTNRGLPSLISDIKNYSTVYVNCSDFWDGLDSPLASWLSTYNSSYDAKPDTDRFYNWTKGAGATDDFETAGSVIGDKVGLTHGGGYPLWLSNSEYYGDEARTLTFDTSESNRTIILIGNPLLSNWFDQSVKQTSDPRFNFPTVSGMTFDGTSHDVKTVFRAGYLLGFQAQDSGWEMTWELWNKDGDGTDNNNLNIWVKGLPDDLNPYELMQIGFLYNAGDPYYQIKCVSTGVGGVVYPLEIYTGANRNQLRLNTDGGIVMAQAVDDVVSNARATYWDSATGQIGYDSSSKRYKENIKDMTNEKSQKVFDLRPVTYDKIDGAKDQIGLIAEEVNELYPQCVFYKREAVMGECIDNIDNSTYECIKSYKLEINKTTGEKIPEGINYECLISPLLKEIQNLNERLNRLEKK